MKAYAGKILHVDLTSGKSRVENLAEQTVKLYLGGMGLGINLLMDHSKPGRDAFDSENPLIYCTGPLSGTLGLAGNGYSVVSKSPVTGGVGEGQVQGFFGSELKRAGYDAVIIKGKAANLSYLWIDDDNIQICDAQHLKGSSVQNVEQKIRNELGDFYIQVSGIGLSGENLCRFATIISDKYHTISRAGLGAVMGSKNLKAIAVRGTQNVDVADLESFTEFVKNNYQRVKNLETGKYQFSSKSLLELNSLSVLANKNWSSTVFVGAEKFDADYCIGGRYVEKTVGCATCGMNCNRVVAANGVFTDVSLQFDFDCLLSLGFLCGVDCFDAVAKAASLIVTYGMDCISVGAAVAFAMDLYEHGLISLEQTGGVDLRFGNIDAMFDLINKIGKREGWLGNVLAEGVVQAAQTIGGEAVNYACHVKGLELPGYDLRVLKNVALWFSVTFSGDRYLRNKMKMGKFGDVGSSKIEAGVGCVVAHENFLCNVLDSLIVCKSFSGVYTWKDLVDYYLFATGIKFTEEELRQVGERVENLARLFNILEGKGTRVYDDLPYKIKNVHLQVGDQKMVVSDEELQVGLDDYYVACGWTADGIPTSARLKQVGLGALSYISEAAIAAVRAQGED
ncbi:MAG: hypothetical protein FWH37_07695 [Candidatus Bathyarchaeota archaeon]|nr:hypothetical protein [Candidatus Termiticorpusculum sp.]